MDTPNSKERTHMKVSLRVATLLDKSMYVCGVSMQKDVVNYIILDY